MSCALLYPPAALAAGLAASLLLGLRRGNAPTARAARCLALLSVLASLACCLLLPFPLDPTELFRRDGPGLALQVLSLIAGIPLILLIDAENEEPIVLILGVLLGASLLASSNHLFGLFLGLETMSLSVYLLLYAARRDRAALEGAIKYFLTGSAAAALYLFGLSIHYAATGDMSLQARSGAGPATELALILMGAAALFKVGAFPMNFWVPDVYEAAPPELAGFLSTGVKAAGFLFLLRLASMFPSAVLLKAWLPWVSAATMTYGTLLALRQERLQRLIAYSSIAHAGLLLAAVWAWLRLGAGDRASATLWYYLAAYLFMNTGAFLFVRMSGIADLRGLRGCAARAPVASAFFTLMLLSLAGMPPTSGFLAKFYVLWDLLRAGGGWLAAVAALNSAVALGYYLRLVKDMVLEEAAPDPAPAAVGNAWPARCAAVACSAVTVLLGVDPAARGWLAGWISR